MFFKNIISINTYREQIQLKYDGGFVVFEECLIVFFDRPFKKVKRSVYAKNANIFKTMKIVKKNIVLSLQGRNDFQDVIVF